VCQVLLQKLLSPSTRLMSYRLCSYDKTSINSSTRSSVECLSVKGALRVEHVLARQLNHAAIGPSGAIGWVNEHVVDASRDEVAQGRCNTDPEPLRIRFYLDNPTRPYQCKPVRAGDNEIGGCFTHCFSIQ